MDELEIEFYYARTRRLLGELPRQEVLRDLHLHALTVLGALQDQYTGCVVASQRLCSPDASDYVRFGVGRRMSMIVFSLRSLLDVVPPEREAPMNADEGRAITRDLNVVYINIVGVIDNLAWAVFHEKAPNALEALQATQIGLFTRAFGRTRELQGLAADVEEYRAWFNELRSRRDPAAHRIPLYLPPSFLNEAQAAEHERLAQQANDVIRRHDWAGWDNIMDQQQQLGRLLPIFLTAPGAAMYHFYPTIPEDSGQMVKIIRVVLDFLQ